MSELTVVVNGEERRVPGPATLLDERGAGLGRSSPQSPIFTDWDVRPVRLPTASIFFTTSMPWTTLPKTTCLPSSQGVATVVIKNCEPLVLGPELAIDRRPGPVCLCLKFSSGNFAP